VLGSELIRRAAELCARKKPLVVSMSGYAASGGFWVATPAARIIADPGTITGSIGVLGGKFNLAGGAAKIGIHTGAIQRGENAGMFDLFSDFTPTQAKIFHDQILGDTYAYFLKLVAAQRHMTIQQVDTIAQGRVWTGEQAVKIKLVDHLGDFEAALNEAKLRAHLDPRQRVGIVELPEQASPLMRFLSGQVYGETPSRPSPILETVLRTLRSTLAQRGVLGRVYCPLTPSM
jgi:protease-4